MSKVVTDWYKINGRPVSQREAAEFSAGDAIDDLEERGAWVTKDEDGSMLLQYQDESIPIDDDKALRKFFRKQGYLPKGSRMHKVTLDTFRLNIPNSHLIDTDT